MTTTARSRFLGSIVGLLAVLCLLPSLMPATRAQDEYTPFNPGALVGLLGNFTQASVPACDSSTQGKYAFLTDMAGGPDAVICRTPGPWARIRVGAPQTVANTSGTVTVTGLSTSNYLIVTGSILSSLTLALDVTSMAPNSLVYVRRPGLLTGVINVQLSSGGGVLNVLGSSTAVFFYDGSTLTQLQ